MTYKEFYENIRGIADTIQDIVNDSQVVNRNEQMAYDDTIIFEFENLVEELLNNATGIYGHTITIEKP